MATRRISASLIAVAMALVPGMATAQSDEADRIREATTALKEIMDAPDKSIPASVFDKAQGIAIFPGTLKGAFVVGGERGKGILSVKDAKGGWSSPAFLTLTAGSIGFQIGGQATDIVLIIQNDRGMRNFVGNEFKIGADASAAAGPVGRNAEAATDVQMRAEILSYSRSRGLFAGISLEGATVKADTSANERFYGQKYTTRQIVYDRQGGSPEPVDAWRALLGQHAK
jgi:lipid-binding SYLF domain-containing protein